MLRVLAIAASDSPEKVAFAQADFSSMADTILQEVQGEDSVKKQNAEKVDTPEARAKRSFLEQAAVTEQKFSSLAEIMESLGKATSQELDRTP